MYKKKSVILGAVLIGVILACGFIYGKEQRLKDHENISNAIEIAPTTGVTFAMDTFVEQKWYGENSQKTYEEINTLIAHLENMLSLHRTDGQIFLLNHNAGIKPVELSKECYIFLQRAKSLSKEYNDSFDITIAPVTDLWGVNSSNPQIPTEDKLKNAISLMGIDELKLYMENELYFGYLEREHMAVDLGGIAKGYAAQLSANIARENGSTGYLSLGGNLGVVGLKPNGDEFKFGVRDPQGDQSEFVAVVTLDGYTMATTGTYERFFEVDGIKYHHVIDPKTGYPAQPELLSVTVISKDGTLADCLSTSLFVSGEEYAKSQLNNENFALILIDKHNKIYVSPWFMDYFKLNIDNKKYTLE